jgi:hypothetical protein
MAKVITSIELADETDVHEDIREGVSNGLRYGTDSGFRAAMTPAQIVEVLVQIDPDDLEDLQQKLYEACYPTGGVLGT